MKIFKILQYNVQASKDKVMVPLLADKKTRRYDVLAIQEPWKNPSAPTTYKARGNGFYLAHNNVPSRACFYINEKLDPNTWTVVYHSSDYCTFILKAEGRTWNIHNIYSEPPGAYNVTRYNTPIPLLIDTLKAPAEHLLVGDFNLHHPMWSGIQDPTCHDAAAPLIRANNQAGLQLLSPIGQVTWARGPSRSTLDLTFGTETIQNRLLTCSIDYDMDNGSDHLPIGTTFALEAPIAPERARRNWKEIDIEKVKTGSKLLIPYPVEWGTEQGVEMYTGYLIQFIQELIEASVPWCRKSQHTVPWWSEEIKEAIKKERRFKRVWLRTRSGQDRMNLLNASDDKKHLIKRAKQKTFREQVDEASRDPNGIWKLARWARKEGGKPPDLPTMPPLNTGTEIAYTIAEKEAVLLKRFFPDVQADLSDIEDNIFADTPDEFYSICLANKEEVKKAIHEQKSKGATGPDDISPRFLKAMGAPLVTALTGLTTACWQAEHYPARFRIAETLCLKKPGKGDYSQPGSWRPIALLSVVGKVIEKVTANRLRELAEEHKLFPSQQMGGRRHRSTYTALELLTEQIHTIWSSKNLVASLLSLDISGAFDSVVVLRLLDVLRKKGIPGWIIRCIRSFLDERKTTISIQGYQSQLYNIPGGCPQGSPLSPILFLFYAAELMSLCSGPKTTAIGFVDDTNILAYGKSTAETCRLLEEAHSKCLAWAKKFGMKFAPAKYELIHFTRRSKKFDMTATVQLGEVTQTPKAEIRILGVWVDSKLKWSGHLRAIKAKLPAYQRALEFTTASTWGACFRTSRQIYTSVVRAAMAYGAPVWHKPSKDVSKPQGISKKLAIIQNKALRRVTGAYKATPIPRLEMEALVPPINLYLDCMVAKYHERNKDTEVSKEIKKACDIITQRIRNRGRGRPRRRPPDTPKQEALKWAKQWKEEGLALPPVDDPDGRAERKKKLQIEDIPMWRKWQAYLKASKDRSYHTTPNRIDLFGLSVHDNLRKAESSVLVQMRTGVNGLSTTLSRLRVPGETEECTCDEGRETTAHYLLWCRQQEPERQKLRAICRGRPLDIGRLLTEESMVSEVCRWIIQTGRFKQFSLAGTFLYG